MAKDTKQINEEINEEKVCADSLVYHLKQQCGCSSVEIWQNKDDPPDFWLTVKGIRFAVEVTSIVTDQGYRANSLNLKRAISCAAQRKLRGRYILKLMDYPNIPKKNSKQWTQLVVCATSFIVGTRDTDTAPGCTLLETPQGSLEIEKIYGNGAAIGLDLIEAKWGGEVEDELHRLMQDAVDKKQEKLRKKEVPAQCPRSLLLLYDAYGYGESKDAQKALLRVKGYDWFHSIYWAASFTDKLNDLYPGEPGRSGIFLYSRDETWWRKPTVTNS